MACHSNPFILVKFFEFCLQNVRHSVSFNKRSKKPPDQHNFFFNVLRLNWYGDCQSLKYLFNQKGKLRFTQVTVLSDGNKLKTDVFKSKCTKHKLK